MTARGPVTVAGVRYPSHRQAAVALYDTGLAPAEVAETLQMPLRATQTAIWAGRRRRATLSLDRTLFTALEPAAARRGITAHNLAVRLIETCVREPALIDNVLDDGAGTP